MNISKAIIFPLIILDVFLTLYILLHGQNIALFNPAGFIANKESGLLTFALILGLSIVIPVVILVFITVFRYKEGSGKAYAPDSDRSIPFQLIWWVIPSVVVLILAFTIWNSTHLLDPYKSIRSDKKPITIEVIALRWKWLFIYPEQNIATVNFIEFPAGTPINFELTADAPMNSFWIPQLSGQIYAMTGMQTQLHVIADKKGEYSGSAAEINGAGFSGMNFNVKAVSDTDYESWLQSVQQSSGKMDLEEYNKLAEPSENNPPAFYAPVQKDLYNQVMSKFMAPSSVMQMPDMK